MKLYLMLRIIQKITGLLMLFLLPVLYAAGQEITVTGNVYSSDDQEPLPAANIRIKGTTRGVVTDINGEYSITVPGPDAVLVYSFVGYVTREYAVGDRTTIDVALEPDYMRLDEIVVIGYGTARRMDLTGAVSVADVGEVKKASATTLSEALQGRIPGVTVKTSGRPGHTASINIRGISSMFSNTAPLFVIDGLPTSETRDFNFDDVESVQVLKDASAAAIYGSRAANGVIIITTKRGVSGEPKIEFTARAGFQDMPRRYDLMEGPEWMGIQRMKYENAGQTPPEIFDETINTDWQKVITETGSIQDYNLSATGGTDNATYLVSGNYFRHDGTVIGPSFDRYSARINGALHGNRWRIEESLLLSTTQSQEMAGSPFTDIIRMVPLIPVRDTLGNFVLGDGIYNGPGTWTNGANPVAHNELVDGGNNSYRIQASLNASYELFEFLTYRINLGYELNQNIFQNRRQYGKWVANQFPESRYYEDRNQYTNRLLENTLNFNRSFSNHNINAIIGYTEQRQNFSNAIGEVRDVLQDNTGKYFWSLSNGESLPSRQNIQNNALRSFLGRVMYDFDTKYYFTASIRRDGSSRFRDEIRYGNFPSASVAWRISSEPFFYETFTFVDDMKFRASYGVLGNEAIGNYLYTTTTNNFQPYLFGDHLVWGATQINMVDSDIKWEEKVSSNIGFDLGLFNNQLYINVDYYMNKSTDLLANVGLPWSAGGFAPTVMTNVGEVENRGWEFTGQYRNHRGEFNWNIVGNVSMNRNKVLELGGDGAPIFGPNTKTEVGRSLGEFFVLITDGIYQVEDTEEMGQVLIFGDAPRPGDERFMDLNMRDEDENIVPGSNNRINADDRVYAGSPWPDMEYSLSFGGSYRNFDFSMFWYGLQGRTVYNASVYWLQNTGDNGNYQRGLEPWTPENRSNTTPRAVIDKVLRGGTDRYLEDGSFLRLKNIQLGYSLPATWLDRVGIEGLRIYINAENLLTVTGYSGLDPDFFGAGPFGIGFDSNHYPNVRTFGSGIQLNF